MTGLVQNDDQNFSKRDLIIVSIIAMLAGWCLGVSIGSMLELRNTVHRLELQIEQLEAMR